MKKLVAVVSVLIAAFSAAGVFAAEPKKSARVPLPMVNVNKDKAEQCVEPTEVMRRDHMTMILHQRDDTMYQGIRTVKYSLKNCVNCHADPQTGSVLGQNGFCESCHSYAAVSMDCFGCHTDKAEKQAAVPPAREAVNLRQLVHTPAPGDTSP